MQHTQAATLSAHLLQEADKFHFYPRKVRRTGTNLASREILDRCRRTLVEWRKTFAPEPEDKGQRALSGPVFLDEVYCRDLLKSIPEIVERTRSLSHLTLTGISDSDSFLYLREAANCYIYGLPQAAVALARAAVEDALRKNVAQVFGKKAVSEADLKNLIDDYGAKAQSLSREGRTLAHRVRMAANEILHPKGTGSPDAKAVIEAARAVILELARRYSVKGAASGPNEGMHPAAQRPGGLSAIR